MFCPAPLPSPNIRPQAALGTFYDVPDGITASFSPGFVKLIDCGDVGQCLIGNAVFQYSFRKGGNDWSEDLSLPLRSLLEQRENFSVFTKRSHRGKSILWTDDLFCQSSEST